jgi:hypothetical protein
MPPCRHTANRILADLAGIGRRLLAELPVGQHRDRHLGLAPAPVALGARDGRDDERAGGVGGGPVDRVDELLFGCLGLVQLAQEPQVGGSEVGVLLATL